MLYFFILGQNPTLSLAEIFAIFNNTKPLFLERDFLIAKADEFESQKLINILGGTPKVGRILEEIARPEIEKFCREKILECQNSKKINFGFSLYNGMVNPRGRPAAYFNAIGLKIKKKLKEQGIASRFVTSKSQTLSSVIVKKNKLIESGVELVFFIIDNRIFIGKTEAVQDFEDWSLRDYDRPCRDLVRGGLPPKLARIMINLSGSDVNRTILDPFCGGGTVLQEAILLGYKNTLGSDISNRAIRDTETNLKWLNKIYNLQTLNYKLFETDIKNLLNHFKPRSIDIIVTEPYLGPAIKGELNFKEAQNLSQKLQKFYLDSFLIFKKILKPQGKIVIIFPVFKAKGQQIFLDILPQIKKQGFQIVNPVPQLLRNNPAVKITAQRGSIIYSRPDQKVLREIFIFGTF